jgi:hypothetical protein
MNYIKYKDIIYYNKTNYIEFVDFFLKGKGRDLFKDGMMTILFQQIGSPEVVLEFDINKNVRKGLNVVISFKVIYDDDLLTLNDLENSIRVCIVGFCVFIEKNSETYFLTKTEISEEDLDLIESEVEKEFYRVCKFFENFLKGEGDE